MADDFLRLEVPPGGGLTGPDLLFAPLVNGAVERSGARFHRWLQARLLAVVKLSAPVMYNTWLDMFDHLDEDRLEDMIPILKACGVDLLEVDAGWYGQGGINQWHDSVGDWTENPSRSFFGKMGEFADGVRARGLGFGLFMEPESAGSRAKVRKQHPDWFKGGGRRFDLENPNASSWMEGEITRLIQQYGLEWMRLDLNSRLGWDEGGSELRAYTQAAQAMFRRIKACHPEVFFEQCASGGMRCDPEFLACGDGMYLSDTQNPVDMIRVTEGLIGRLPPGRFTRLIACRSLARTFPGHPVDPDNMPETLAFPPAAVAMMGVLAVSGDPASLSPESQRRLGELVAFYRSIQSRVMGASATLLTPARPLHDRRGWSVFQYHGEGGSHIVFAFRLHDAAQAILQIALLPPGIEMREVHLEPFPSSRP